MKIHVLFASAMMLAGLSSSAMALTLTNSDDAPYKIAVTTNDGKSQTVDLAANATAEVDCATGCVLALNDQTMNVDAATAAVTVSQGMFTK